MLERIGLHAGAIMDHQDGGTLSGDLVVIGQIALELLVAVIVIDPFLLYFRFRGTGREYEGGNGRKAENSDFSRSSGSPSGELYGNFRAANGGCPAGWTSVDS